jgi:hypothetical protein
MTTQGSVPTIQASCPGGMTEKSPGPNPFWRRLSWPEVEAKYRAALRAGLERVPID